MTKSAHNGEIDMPHRNNQQPNGKFIYTSGDTACMSAQGCNIIDFVCRVVEMEAPDQATIVDFKTTMLENCREMLRICVPFQHVETPRFDIDIFRHVAFGQHF